MNIARLGNALKQELARNKAQTMVLGAIFVVALYLWTPLLGKWIGFGKARQTAKADTSKAEASKPAAAEMAEQTSNQPARRWDQLVQWRRNNPLMASATFDQGGRDPFRSREARQTDLDDESQMLEAQPPPPIKEVEADEVFVVTSTIVGGSRRLATINGRIYPEEATIRVVAQRGIAEEAGAETAPGGEMSFELTEIHSDYVVLSRNGKQHKLLMDRDWLTMGGRVIVHRSPPTD